MARVTVIAYDTGQTKLGPETWTPNTYTVPLGVTPNGSSPFCRTTSPIRRLGGNTLGPESIQPGQRA